MAASDSKLYIFGGRTLGNSAAGADANDLHEYDIASRAWTDLSSPSSGTPPTPRNGHGMAALDSKLFIFGGQANEETQNDLHVYELSSRRWIDLTSSSAGTPPSARYGMGIAASGSHLFTFGGLADEALNDLHEYDCNGAPPRISATSLLWACVLALAAVVGGRR